MTDLNENEDWKSRLLEVKDKDIKANKNKLM